MSSRSTQDLFGAEKGPARPEPSRPLAERLRPATLDAVVGQDHLVGPDGTLTRMLGALASLILWVPPVKGSKSDTRSVTSGV